MSRHARVVALSTTPGVGMSALHDTPKRTVLMPQARTRRASARVKPGGYGAELVDDVDAVQDHREPLLVDEAPALDGERVGRGMRARRHGERHQREQQERPAHGREHMARRAGQRRRLPPGGTTHRRSANCRGRARPESGDRGRPVLDMRRAGSRHARATTRSSPSDPARGGRELVRARPDLVGGEFAERLVWPPA